MARFKTISYIIAKEKKQLVINVDGTGTFSLNIPNTIAEALGIDRLLENKNAEKLELEFHKYLREYNKLTVKSIYRIKYRICFTNRIKDRLPTSVMNDDAWKATARIGSEYMPEKAIGIIIDWFPLEMRTKGKEEVETKLVIPDEDDFWITNAKKALEENKDAEFYLSNIHKPYDGLILVEDSRHWEFDRQHEVYRDIPLTKETFEFFTAIEGSFVAMLSKLFSFLARDEKFLMADIHKMIESNSLKQLGFSK